MIVKNKAAQEIVAAAKPDRRSAMIRLRRRIAARGTAAGPDGRKSRRSFPPAGLLSKSRNFEYRPQQQHMAVAVARALEDGGKPDRRSRHRRGQEPGLFDSVHSFCRRAAQEGGHLHAHDQFAGAIDPKDLPMLASILPVKFQFTMLKGRHNYLCTRRLQKAAHRRATLHLAGRAGTASAFTNGPKKPRTAACRISRSSRTPRSGSKSAPSAALHARNCGHCPISSRMAGAPVSYQRARSRILAVGRAGAQSHAVFHAHGRAGGGTQGRRAVQK